eukprot:TRINITY_DN3629_c0_g1_i1.p1 TRINITY_DN3629_c0_g1~~TRINITY_DN3629_c0_g1_i1.p1  ORF type:complete len:470 (-),score=90.87 TRINITY_DN3629_c0_g1_i1:42-1349(-)
MDPKRQKLLDHSSEDDRDDLETVKESFFTRNYAWVFVLPFTFVHGIWQGMIYTFSVLQSPIEHHCPQWNEHVVPIAISLMVAFTAFSGIFMGPIIHSIGLRRIAILATLVLSVSLECVGLCIRHCVHPVVLALVFGVVCGFSCGTLYLSILHNVVSWHITRRGFASGFLGTCVGLGSILFSQVEYRLQEKMDAERTFYILGIALLITGMPWTPFLRFAHHPPPAQANSSAAKPMTRGQVISQSQFWFFYVAFFCSLTPGWGLVSVMTNFFEDTCNVDSDHSAVLIGFAFGFYTLGRISWGVISDKVGRRTTYLIFLISQTIICIVFPFCLRLAYSSFPCAGVFSLLALLLTLFGGAKAIFGAFATEIFGPLSAPVCIGLYMSAFGLSALVGPALMSALVNDHRTRSRFEVFFWTAAGFTGLGTGFATMIRPVSPK